MLGLFYRGNNKGGRNGDGDEGLYLVFIKIKYLIRKEYGEEKLCKYIVSKKE